jgi:hypothetical protein
MLFYTFLVVTFFYKITKKCIFPLKFLHFFAPGSGSGFPIRIRIHKVIKTGSNPDPDPQPWFPPCKNSHKNGNTITFVSPVVRVMCRVIWQINEGELVHPSVKTYAEKQKVKLPQLSCLCKHSNLYRAGASLSREKHNLIFIELHITTV